MLLSTGYVIKIANLIWCKSTRGNFYHT